MVAFVSAGRAPPVAVADEQLRVALLVAEEPLLVALHLARAPPPECIVLLGVS